MPLMVQMSRDPHGQTCHKLDAFATEESCVAGSADREVPTKSYTVADTAFSQSPRPWLSAATYPHRPSTLPIVGNGLPV